MEDASNSEVATRIQSVYDAATAAYGTSSRAVLCGDQQRQYLRFNTLTQGINLTSRNLSVLDVGCGTGELAKFLNFSGFRGRYLGIDVTQDLLSHAQRKYPTLQFLEGDITNVTSLPAFDYVIASGILNIDVGQSMSWVKDVLLSMWQLTECELRIDGLSTFVNYRESHLFYVDPLELLSWAIQTLSPFVTLQHHALPYNFALFVSRSSEWVSLDSTDGR